MTAAPHSPPKSPAKIHLVIGTKAQLIKMLPIITELRQRKIPFRYIDTCQHPVITATLREAFGLDEPDVILGNSAANISGVGQAFVWLLKILATSFMHPKRIFGERGGVCLVHGDTLSTLLGMLMGKRAGQKIAHVEAGERTHRLSSPFPEELIRVIVDRYTDYAFSSSEVSETNLRQEGIKGEIIPLPHNSIVDAIQIAAAQENIKINVPETFVLVSIHRFETIQSRERMEFVIETVLRVSKKFPVVWGLHEPTKKRLQKFQLLDRISNNPRIDLRGLWDYFAFIKAIKQAEFLVTDGGGPQEESWFLNTPCMLMRSETERELHPNVHRTNFEAKEVDYFLENYKTMESDDLKELESPSQMIVDFLEKYLSDVRSPH